MLFYLIAAFMTGAILPAQRAMNTRLRVSLGTNAGAALVSFFFGAIFMALWVASRGDSFLPPPGTPLWTMTGGVFAVCSLVTVIYLFPKLGALETVALPVIGKIVSALLIDNFGWFNAPQQPITVWRVIGDLLVLTGVIMTVSGNKRTQGAQVLPRILGTFIGIYAAIQAAFNGNLTKIFGSGPSSGFFSMSVAALFLVLVCLVTRQIPKKIEPGPWWMWLGGILSGLLVTGTASVQPQLGTGVALLVILLGQVTASIVVDHFALFEAKRTPITWLRLLGACLLACGMCLYYMY